MCAVNVRLSVLPGDSSKSLCSAAAELVLMGPIGRTSMFLTFPCTCKAISTGRGSVTFQAVFVPDEVNTQYQSERTIQPIQPNIIRDHLRKFALISVKWQTSPIRCQQGGGGGVSPAFGVHDCSYTYTELRNQALHLRTR